MGRQSPDLYCIARDTHYLAVLDSPVLSFGCLDFIVLFTKELPPLLLTSEFLETLKKAIQ